MKKKATNQAGSTVPKELNSLVGQMQASMAKLDSIAGHLDGLFSGIGSKIHRAASEDLPKWKQNLEGVRNLGDELNQDIKDYNTSQDVQNKIQQTGYSQRVAELEVSRDLALAHAKSYNVTKEHIDDINKEYDKTVAIAKTRDEMLQDQETEMKAAERIKKIDSARSDLMDKINKKAAIAKLIFKDQRALAAAGMATMIKGYHSLNETFDEFRKEGLSVGQAMKETGVSVAAMFSLSGASLKENQELMSGMAESMGNMNGITTDTVVEVGKLAKTFGVSLGAAGKLQGQLQNMPGATAESATSTMEFAGALAMAAHVAPGAVMKDMAANAEAIALNTKNGGKDMAAVSVAAHKLGVEMSSLTKMSAGLLDFENSINKQMEASVLLGREVNLDKARELALNGDIVGATKEMLKNVGGEAEFNKMNALQRQALADSMSVSVSDLSKLVKNQDQLNTLTEEQKQALKDGVPISEVLAANAAGFTGKITDGALSIGGMVSGFGLFARGLKDSAGMAKGMMDGFKGGAGMFGKMGGVLKGAVGLGKTPKVPSTDALADSGKKMSGGGTGEGIKTKMINIAEGIKAFGNTKVLFGALNLIPASIGLIAFIPGILGAKLVERINGEKFQASMYGLAYGIEAMGKGKVFVGSLGLIAASVGLIAMIPGVIGGLLLGASASFIAAGLAILGAGLEVFGAIAATGIPFLGILLLAAFGAALIPFGYALSLATPAIEAFGNVILKVFTGIGIVIKAAAEGLSTLFTSLGSVDIAHLLAIGPALIMIGVGLAALGGGSILGAIGSFLGGDPIKKINSLAEAGAGLKPTSTELQGIATALTNISTSLNALDVTNLDILGSALFSVSDGLSAMVGSGFMAIPIIGALTGLALVAPALRGIADIFGNGGTGSNNSSSTKDDVSGMESSSTKDAVSGMEVVKRLDRLIKLVESGHDINIDGKKLGMYLALAAPRQQLTNLKPL